MSMEQKRMSWSTSSSSSSVFATSYLRSISQGHGMRGRSDGGGRRRRVVLGCWRGWGIDHPDIFFISCLLVLYARSPRMAFVACVGSRQASLSGIAGWCHISHNSLVVSLTVVLLGIFDD